MPRVFAVCGDSAVVSVVSFGTFVALVLVAYRGQGGGKRACLPCMHGDMQSCTLLQERILEFPSEGKIKSRENREQSIGQ